MFRCCVESAQKRMQKEQISHFRNGIFRGMAHGHNLVSATIEELLREKEKSWTWMSEKHCIKEMKASVIHIS